MHERVDVLTAEAVPFALEPAGVGSRLIAVLLDSSIQAMLMVAMAIIQFVANTSIGGTPGGWIHGTLTIGVFVVYFLYFPVFEAVWKGQTPGKRRLHLRVVKVNGQPIGAGEAFLRGIVRVVDVHLFVVGFVVAILSRRGQRLGDFLAGTIVIKERSFVLPDTVSDAVPFWLTDEQISTVRRWRDRISHDEIALVREFLERRDEIHIRVRTDLAEKLASLAEKVEIPTPSLADAERFLEDLARIYAGE